MDFDALGRAQQLDGDDLRGVPDDLLELERRPMPMLTKSSLLAEVGIESAEAGWANVLFSEASAAATYCGIIQPDSRPGLCAK